MTRENPAWGTFLNQLDSIKRMLTEFQANNQGLETLLLLNPTTSGELYIYRAGRFSRLRVPTLNPQGEFKYIFIGVNPLTNADIVAADQLAHAIVDTQEALRLGTQGGVMDQSRAHQIAITYGIVPDISIFRT